MKSDGDDIKERVKAYFQVQQDEAVYVGNWRELDLWRSVETTMLDFCDEYEEVVSDALDSEFDNTELVNEVDYLKLKIRSLERELTAAKAGTKDQEG